MNSQKWIETFGSHVLVDNPKWKGTGIAQLVWQLAMGWMAGVQFPAGTRDFCILQCTDCSEALPDFFPLGTRSSFPRGKAAVVWSSPLTYIWCQSQEWWSYTSTPSYIFMAWCIINLRRDNFTFYQQWKRLFVIPGLDGRSYRNTAQKCGLDSSGQDRIQC
jgi:hypothetical protein